MLKSLLLLYILEHPVTTHIILMPTSNTEQTARVRDHSSTELRNVFIKIDEILGLLAVDDIVKMDVLVAPFEVVDDALVSELLLDDEEILEELYYVLFNINVVVLSDHRLVGLKVVLILCD